MKAPFISCIIIILFSCNKNKFPDFGQQYANNRMDVSLKMASGEILSVKAAGNRALFGCGAYGLGTYVQGTGDNNVAVYCNINDCINGPGKYSCNSRYTPKPSSDTRDYETNGVDNPGSITFTVLNHNHAEGYFSAVCKRGSDSVIVIGTFSGYFGK
jgi:hypothetical protein